MTRREHNENTINFPHESASLPMSGAAAIEKIPVIMLTSHAEKTHKIAATIAGVFDILIKPEKYKNTL